MVKISFKDVESFTSWLQKELQHEYDHIHADMITQKSLFESDYSSSWFGCPYQRTSSDVRAAEMFWKVLKLCVTYRTICSESWKPFH